ncbi:signaling lymphocytic activation molecule isoform X2 [Rhinatrema bivittatum]|uniref:signaling lymphocytic activation molecule isoform X2 n=1 Tax=Rhinatrema bivittatum TaxID=194408 RepID=UPI001127002C|nr:signaling lymphocytic activation molecule isoform X2 [Rhinatrema bivittatum]
MGCTLWFLLTAALFSAGVNFCSPHDLIRINGTLGRSFQLLLLTERDAQFKYDKVTLKKQLDQTKKKILFSYNRSSNESPHYQGRLQNRSRFHPENFSLEIWEAMREDSGQYELIQALDDDETTIQLQLEVYEEISVSSVPVTKMLENATCTMLLNCTVEKGDSVTYAWTESQGNITWPLAHNASILIVTPGPGNASVSYACHARNPISQSSRSYSPWMECYPSASSSAAVSRVLIAAVLSSIIGFIIITGFLYCVYRHRHNAKTGFCLNKDPCPESTYRGRAEVVNEPMIHTIYSTVQKPVQANKIPQAAENPESLTVYEQAWSHQASSTAVSRAHQPPHGNGRPGGTGPKESPSGGPAT